MAVETILLETMPINGQMTPRSVKIQMATDMATMPPAPTPMHSLTMAHNGQTVTVTVGVTILAATIQMHSLTITHSNRILTVTDTETIPTVPTPISAPTVHLERLWTATVAQSLNSMTTTMA